MTIEEMKCKVYDLLVERESHEKAISLINTQLQETTQKIQAAKPGSKK